VGRKGEGDEGNMEEKKKSRRRKMGVKTYFVM